MLDLQRISREGGSNFDVPLEGAPTLHCLEVVRRIAGRRLVCRGVWQGQAVFAKLFIGSRARRYAERDAGGAKALLSHQLLAPELLHEGDIADQPGIALIYAYVAESQNAEFVWQEANAPQRRLLADALVRTVALHHAAGLVQTDLYSRNFLCTDAGIYTLDGDGIRIHRHPIPQRLSMANLALLLSKFDVLDDVRIPEWLRIYTEERGWPQSAVGSDALQKQVQALRRTLVRKNVYRKVLRDCSDVRVEKRFNRFLAVVRNQQDDNLRQVIDVPNAYLDAPACQRLKNGNTCTVGLVQAGERKIVIKRYNIKNFWHGLSRALRTTRASLSWSNAHLLRAFEIATPAPLALIELRWGPFRRQGYFLTDFVAGPDITEVLADTGLPGARKQEIATDVARLLHKLYLLKIEHGDMKATNLKLVDDKPLLLDLDAMKQHSCDRWFRHRHARDLRRFLKNWHNAPDILRMLKSALMTAYGDDPVLKMAGITQHDTSEYK
jgi:tRNA A-37 threonylcarbamoyl transferase component Bud32